MTNQNFEMLSAGDSLAQSEHNLAAAKVAELEAAEILANARAGILEQIEKAKNLDIAELIARRELGAAYHNLAEAKAARLYAEGNRNAARAVFEANQTVSNDQ